LFSHSMKFVESSENCTQSVSEPTERDMGVASNVVVSLKVSDGLSVPIVVVPFEMTMSHDVMSVPGSSIPVEPSVVIVPVTVYPFWRVG
jgi:hypothetical protein